METVKEEDDVSNIVVVDIDLVSLYISQLSSTHKKVFLIAQEHLGTSFHIQKSNGYIQWLQQRNQHDK